MLTTLKIGNKIIEARKKLNISQAQLAEKLSISSQAVGKWERGESMPDIVTFNRLAEVLGVDLNYFSENYQSVVIENESRELVTKEDEDLTVNERQQNNRWDMSRGSWVDADFSGLKNLKDKFSSSNIQNCLFVGSDLVGLLLKGNHIEISDFSNANLSKSKIEGSNILNCIFKESTLKDGIFSSNQIKGCDFTASDFTGTIIKSCALIKNKTTDVVWNNTAFQTTQLKDIVFEGLLTDCSFENCEFSSVTFQNATLIKTFFKNKSLKKIRFINCEADSITYAFLKSGKADMKEIRLITT